MSKWMGAKGKIQVCRINSQERVDAMLVIMYERYCTTGNQGTTFCCIIMQWILRNDKRNDEKTAIECKMGNLKRQYC